MLPNDQKKVLAEFRENRWRIDRIGLLCEKLVFILDNYPLANESGGPGAVLKTAYLESRRSRVQSPLWPSSFKETNVSFPITPKYSKLGESP